MASAQLDLSRAFDSISHNLLLAKQNSFNFDTSAINLKESYLKNRSQKRVLQIMSSDWIHLYQGVPQGTIIGQLLFKLYVNSKINTIIKPRELAQYAYDTFLFVANANIEDAIRHVKLNISKMVHFFQIKNILNKMACGIKTLYAVKSFLPQEFFLNLLNAQTVSQIQHPAILLNSISQNLVTSLEKQLNWAVEACFDLNNSDSSSDLKIKYSFFPSNYCLKIGLLHTFGNNKTVCYQHSRPRRNYRTPISKVFLGAKH